MTQEAIRLYGLKRCSTCVKAVRWLEAHGIPYEFTDYRDDPVAPELLQAWAQQVGGWEKLVNRASMTWRNLPADRKEPATVHEWQALAAEFPTLIKRPVMVRPDGAIDLGFSEKKYIEILG